MLKKPSVNHVSEHLSMMSPVYTSGGGEWTFNYRHPLLA